jgi:peptidoglycan/LPS O-acetylase OafA/YrhL
MRLAGVLPGMPATPSAPYRRDIDGLRAIAVLLVIIHHVAPDLLPGGFVGVDVFFVISGYLMTGILDASMRDGSYRYVDFVWKRCRRIVPALVAVLVATLIMGACIMTGPELVNLARHVIAGSLSSSNLLLWSEVGYFDVSAAIKPLLHLWSLGIEEQFYLLWPLLLSMLPLIGRTRLLVVVAITALSLMISENLAYAEPSQAFYLLHSRAWELSAGAIVALVWPISASASRPPGDRWNHLRAAASALGLALILGAAWKTRATDAWPGLSALAPVVGTALLLAAGPRAVTNHALLANGVARWIGQRSYALYLWHWPPLAFLHILAAERAWSAGTLQWAGLLLMLPVAVLSHATLTLIERPARDRAARVAASSAISARHLTPYGLMLGALALTSAALIRAHGLPNRYGTAGTDAVAMLRDASPDSITAYGAFATRCRLADAGNATWCWRTAGTGKGIAVFGDSHAEVLFAGLADLKVPRPMMLTGRKGCAPLLQPDVIDNRLSEICRRASQLAHAAIRSDTGIGTVLLVSRGAAYVTGAGFGIDTQRPVVPVTRQRTPQDTLELQRALESGLEESIRSFIAAGKRVVLLIGVPELGFLPEECLIGRPFGLRAIRTPCAVPRRMVDRRNHEYRALVRRLSARIPALEVVDASAIFCDDQLCHAERNGRLLYQDGNHLTLTGSRLVVAQLRAVLALPAQSATIARALERDQR